MIKVMSSRLDRVAEMATTVKQQCKHLGFEQGDAIELAITEALNNVILHAHKELYRLSIEVSVERIGLALQICVTDHLNSLDSMHRRRLVGGPPAILTLAESGRGLDIICEIMDHVDYVDGQLRMTMMLPEITSYSSNT